MGWEKRVQMLRTGLQIISFEKGLLASQLNWMDKFSYWVLGWELGAQWSQVESSSSLRT